MIDEFPTLTHNLHDLSIDPVQAVARKPAMNKPNATHGKRIVLAILASVLIAACAGAVHQRGNQDDVKTFRNNYLPPQDKNALSFLRMRLFGDDIWADQIGDARSIEVLETDPATLKEYDSPQITWVGHSTFLLQIQGRNILTDPIFSTRASPVSFAGPKRLVGLPLSMEELPTIDAVVISHNHYDHLDEASIRALGNEPMYFVPEGLGQWFVDNGIAAERVQELAWWESSEWQNLRISATPSQHWSARSLFDRNQSHWASWLLQFEGFSVWFAGDTGYNDRDFRDIGAFAESVDLALIPIGAYAPRHFMKPHHVNEEEALQIHRDVRARKSIGMHWGTFPLTAESPLDPPRKLAALAELLDDDSRFVTMKVGETVAVDTL